MDSEIQRAIDEVGRNVMLQRNYKGKSFEDINDETGISISKLAAIEEGTIDCDILTLQLIANYLDVDVRDFFE